LHAGRKGVYFRKSLAGNQSRTASYNSVDTLSTNYSDEIFIDTGVTYPSNIRKTEVDIEPVPQFPPAHKAQTYLYILGFFILFFALQGSSLPFTIIGGILSLAAIFLSIENFKLTKGERVTLELIAEFKNSLNNSGNVSSVVNSKRLYKLNPQFVRIFNYQIMLAVVRKYIDKLDINTKNRILKLKDYIQMSDETFRSVKVRTFKQVFDEYMEDHLLEEDEERILSNFATNLDLSDSDIQEELRSIEIMSQIRKEMNSELSPIPTDIKLQKSEDCFYSAEARILKKKILKTQTIQGTKLKHVGYIIEKEGTVYLTNKRILMVSEGTSTIKLEKVFDVTAIPEANIVELVVDGRKTPIIFTLHGAMALATKIEKTIEAFITVPV